MEANEKKSGFLVQGSILAIASIFVRIIGLVYRVPLTRIVGDAGMGFYSTAFEVYNIALLLSSYSLPLAVSKLIANRLAKGEKKNAVEVFKCAFIFAVVAGFFVFVLTYFGASFISDRMLNTYLSYIALKVLAPGLFIVAILGVLRGYFQGYGTMVPTAISQILEQIINAVVSVIAASYLYAYGKQISQAVNVQNKKLVGPAYGAAGGTLGTVSGAFFALVFLSIFFVIFNNRHKIEIFKTKKCNEEYIETRKQVFKVLFATIIPIIFSSVVYNICNILDQGIFNHTMDYQGYSYGTYARMLGIYSNKFLLLINVPLAIANALGASSVPSLTTSLVKGKISDVKDKISMTVRFTMLIAIPSFVGYAFMSSPILKLLFNDSRSLSAHVLTFGSIMVMFYSLSTVTNAILQGLDKMTYPIKNACISLGIQLVFLLVFLFVFKLHVYSLVFSNCIFSLSMCILNQRDIRKTCGYKQEIKKTFLKPFIAALIMGTFVKSLHYILMDRIGFNVSTVITLLIAIAFYLLLIIKLKVVEKEELLKMPKGKFLVKTFEKIHLL